MKATIKEPVFKPVTLEIEFESRAEIMALYFIVSHYGVSDSVERATQSTLWSLREKLEELEVFDEQKWNEFRELLKKSDL